MKMHENLKKEGKSRKNYKPRRGVKVQFIMHSWSLLNSNCSVGPSESETKFSSKEIWYGLREIAWFPWHLLYDSRDGG